MATVNTNGTGGGDGNTAASFAGSVLPDSTSDVVCLSGDQLTDVPVAGVNWNSLTINSGAHNVNLPGTNTFGTGGVTSNMASGSYSVTLGSSGATHAQTFTGPLVNSSSGTLTVNGNCSGVTNHTPNNENQNASIAMTGTITGPAGGRTWNQNADLTGVTVDVAAYAGTWNVAAGVTLSLEIRPGRGKFL